jgi:hypothetical protein
VPLPDGLLLAPFLAQASATLFDERVFHRGRRLPRWERLGHPLDTLTVLACYGWLVASPPSGGRALVYVALATFSCLFVTKDEAVHASRCPPGEHWTHAVLFLLHPVVLIDAGYLWGAGRLRVVLLGEVLLTAALAVYQLLYWNGPWGPARRLR